MSVILIDVCFVPMKLVMAKTKSLQYGKRWGKAECKLLLNLIGVS